MNETLLLVDDEEGIRNVLKISLLDAGYSVVTAASVDEALVRFGEKRPDIVLTDIKMPGRTGIDLLKAVKEMDSNVEVIMLTGHGDLELAIRSLKLDATDFLTKPVNDEVLGHALKRAAERIEMRRNLREYAENLEAMVREQSARLVEAERQLAAVQVIEGLSAGFASLANTLTGNGSQSAGSEAPLSADDLFNLLPCFVSIHSNRQKIVAVNRLFRERLGDLTGEASASAYAPEFMPDPAACPVGRVLGMGVGQRADGTLVDKQGRHLPVSLYAVPIYNNEGDVELVLELAVDSSEVRRLREDLRLTRERYRRLFEESPSYAVVVDREMRIVEANRRFRSDFGPPEGRRCHELYMHRQSACADCPAKRSLEDDRTHQWESVVTARDGRKVNVLVVTAPLHDADGNSTEVMELSTDITELRNLQDHLSQLGLLLGSTAHGIKGLLTALDGSVYRMGSGLKQNNTERVEDGFRDMRLLVGRMRKMMLDILYYSKNRELAWEEVPVAAFAVENLGLIEEKAGEQGVRLIREFVLDGDGVELGVFEADSGAVSSALVNLLENAVEASAANPHPPPEGRSVTLRVECGAEQVRFIVADTGSGMDRETRDKLFTLFFSSKGSAGTGIGLYIAGQVVRRHGGSISVESEPGGGAVFTVTLPRRLSADVRNEPAPYADEL
jgi:PAS domain S-box-containing protein